MDTEPTPTLDELTWLDSKQLERFYGIKTGNQKHLRKAKLIPFAKVGHYIRYKKTDIESWLDSHIVEGV